ncbi:MAG TPA: type I secretion C-terminal target domain-containing protein [Polaromonas sp.]|uniref:type I secretion C-terminal target domain-containing protein n=1 Tax=Polaromonas sp. TaxID=1869339 RepID=UPI002D3745A6|nr:type I secretion C-terminal target domain-containing protein [Polaromonas sp.]HYW58208.1 type I secretion C-terminal target domain-containing protein [Polaromonas sp.]
MISGPCKRLPFEISVREAAIVVGPFDRWTSRRRQPERWVRRGYLCLGVGQCGTARGPVTDTITDFNLATRAAGGDVLDLRDLLVGESVGTLLGQDNLANFLHFEKSGADTIVHISTTGGFASDPHAVGAPSGVVSAAEDQRIVLSGVDMIGSFTTDQQVIQDMLTKGKLNTD